MKFSPEDRDKPSVERRIAQFLFKAGENFTLMDVTTYDQFELTPEQIGSAAAFMKEGLDGISLIYFVDRVIGIELPPVVELAIVSIEQKQANGEPALTLATLETGGVVAVPSSTEVGQIVRIETKSGNYLGHCVEP